MSIRPSAHLTLIAAALALLLASDARAAVTTAANGEILSITSTAGSDVTVTVDGGLVKVNGVDVSPMPTAAADLRYIYTDVIGDGTMIDYRPMSADQFTQLLDVTTNVSGDGVTVHGWPGADTVSFNTGTGITVDGGAGADSFNLYAGMGTIDYNAGDDFDQFTYTDYDNLNDAITIDSDSRGNPRFRLGATVEAIIREAEFVQLYPQGGNDTVVVDSGSWTNPMSMYMSAGGGTNNYNLSAFTHSIRTDITPMLGDTTYNFSNQSTAIVQVSFGLATGDISGTITRSGDNIQGQFTGGVAGSFRVNRAQRIEYRSGSGRNQIAAGNLDGADLELLNLLGSDNDDSFSLVMSSTISYNVFGSGSVTGNSLTIDPNGFAASITSMGVVSAPGAMSVHYNDIQNLTILGVTPTTNVLAILLGAVPHTPAADVNGDGITDAADVTHEIVQGR